jgi:Iron-sulfur cluster binding domain of dihydroorotate dehydrogenase B
MPKKMGLNVIFPWRNVWHAESVPALPVCANPEKKMHIAMWIIRESARMARYFFLRRWKS